MAVYFLIRRRDNCILMGLASAFNSPDRFPCRWRVVLRRILAISAIAFLCLVNVACPEKEKTLRQLQAREAQLNRELEAAARRDDMDAVLEINRELNDIKEIYRRLDGEATGVQAGAVIARYPVLEADASNESQDASNKATRSAANSSGRVRVPKTNAPPRQPATAAPVHVHHHH